jgi:nitrate/TMAO reductase-like tetraheme cytochrome c subunit
MNGTGTPPRRSSVFRNWLSLAGFVVIIGSVFSFLLLLLLDAMSHFANPYVGILTFMVAPAFFIFGSVLAVVGAFLRHRQIVKFAGPFAPLRIDLTRSRDRKALGIFLTAGVLFLLASAMGSYETYHYTESVQFCGEACHQVMKPELVTYLNSPHARIACAECHVGKGAEWYIRSKLTGTYQLYATLAHKYPTPIPTPVKNLRPAQETCEECHWPKKFIGNLDRTYSYFLSDETNTPFSVRLSIKVGGGDPTHGPTGGIHWHMNVGNSVQYLAADENRQKIPYVRMIDAQGVVTEFRGPNFTNAINEGALRKMDCMDCHNRPAHRYETPNGAVNLAMALDKIDRSLPYAKTNALFALTRPYKNETEARQSIATILAQRYPQGKHVPQMIETVQQIYQNTFFPEMKANWQSYPDNVGHKDWPGCFRCHDGLHRTADGKRIIKANDCNACHTILAQGTGEELKHLTPDGQKFKHPGDEVDGSCSDCHTGGL